METILRTLAICIALAIAAPLHAANPIILTPPGQGATALVPVLVDSDGVIQRPTNFFAANFSQVSSQLATNHPTYQQATSIVDTAIAEALDDAILTETTESNVIFNLDLPASFPNGLQGVDMSILMHPFRYGSGITNASPSPIVANLAPTGTVPPGSFVLTNGADVSTNFIEFFCALPAAPLRTNDPVLTFSVFEGFHSSLTNSIVTISWVASTNGFRIDNATRVTYGTVTNDHSTAGPGARHVIQHVTLTGAGERFTNSAITGFNVRIARGTDDYTNSIAILPDVRLTVRK